MVNFQTKNRDYHDFGTHAFFQFPGHPELCPVVELAAVHENRSKTNLVETLALKLCRKCSIKIDGQAGSEEPVVKSSRAHSEHD